ncbi:sporulation protein YdcC [Halobacillus andaensis]|uniref:Sporulation protein YdcC n=1 Tax=Halobacillus andaensis TaxID=1176239 RepID=A0A917B9Q4_HALAA|nr:outer membrane lipoprotein carrier protein LolA [Halobacillus andaensis]MBP2006195.1 outer membrane lipoprotein-sorting protein [Halobacillus andaensis]GGF33190.1 sporulation protein YdcC [Halobacillus andaensis]
MKRFPILFFMAMALTLVLTACGEQSKEDVVKKLEEQESEMKGYKTDASMTMKTGKEEQKYHIQISHKKKDFYKVELENDQDEKGSQIILKNDSGVYVLTPALNKSFKFQSDWPENTSQPYLFNSLIKDIKADAETEFNATDNHYVFKTKTNYQNNQSLPYQEIYFDKKSYTPVMVKVFDQDMTALVEVQFSNFSKDDSFKETDFDVDQNMAMSSSDVPVTASEEQTEAEVLYPEETLGASLWDKQEVETENGKRVIMTYKGEKDFTIIQETAATQPASARQSVEVNGEPVQLSGGLVGALSEQKLEWNDDATTYHLASNELTQDEMVAVANSIHGYSEK